MEEYRKIQGYNNYSVSNLGNVRNDKTGRLLKATNNSHGYYFVELCQNNKGKKHYLHRLVAKTFIPNPHNKKCVDHIDNNTFNNIVENLRWATLSENQGNRKMNQNSKSGAKGICWDKKYKKWRVCIMIDGKSKHLGLYENLEDAKQARMIEANKIFGEFINSCE